MDWVDFIANTVMLAVSIYIGRLIGRREERRKVPAPVPVVDPPPKVRTYTVEVGRVEAFSVRGTSAKHAVTDAVEKVAIASGGAPGRFMALCLDVPYLIVRAPKVDNNPTTESP